MRRFGNQCLDRQVKFANINWLPHSLILVYVRTNFINTLTWTVTVCPSRMWLIMTPFPFEVRIAYQLCQRHTCASNIPERATHTQRFGRILSLRPTRTQNSKPLQLACGHTCVPARANMNPTQYLGRIAWLQCMPWLVSVACRYA